MAAKKKNGPPKRINEPDRSPYVDQSTREWWRMDGKHATDALTSMLLRAREDDASRRDRMKSDLSLYLNRNITSLDAWDYAKARDRTADNPRLNAARSAVDTLHAQMVKSLPRSVPLTEDGTWTAQRQAKAYGLFLDAVKDRNAWRVTFPMLVRDALVLDPGVVRCHSVVDDDNVGTIKLTRVLPHEILVDAVDAVYGTPRCLYYQTLVDRRVAQETWPEHRDAIERAPRAERMGTTYRSGSDQVEVIEAWHLPSRKGAKDGAHTVVVLGVDAPMSLQPWTRESFPFAMLSYSPGFMGVFGTTLVDEIAGLHVTLNEVDETIRDRIAQSTGFFINYLGSKLKLRLDNDTRTAIYDVEAAAGEGQVEYHSPNLVSAELLSERERLLGLTLQMPGISQLAARSMKPAGLDSGVALREYQDIEAERFAAFGKQIEAFELQVSRLIRDEARDLDAAGVDIEVKASSRKRGRRVMARIRWKDFAKAESDFEIQVFPASQLPRQPAGRLAMVEQLIAAGFLGKDDAMRLLDFPDVEATMQEQLAPYHLALECVESILEDGELVAPIPEMDLALTARVVNLAILRATLDKAPGDRIGMLRTFANQVQTLASRAAQAQAGPAGGFVPNAAGQLQAGLPQNAAPQGAAVIA
jgi:hypothetical protein